MLNYVPFSLQPISLPMPDVERALPRVAVELRDIGTVPRVPPVPSQPPPAVPLLPPKRSQVTSIGFRLESLLIEFYW